MLCPAHITFLCDPLLFEIFNHPSEERCVNHKTTLAVPHSHDCRHLGTQLKEYHVWGLAQALF